jgi:hypothetical protein
MATNEPGAAVLAIFDQLVNRIKQAHPVRSDDKPLGGGVVYSMMVLGMPVDPIDYTMPWVPQGDIDVSDAVKAGQLPAPAADGSSTPPPPDPKAARALAAAYKTSALCNKLLQVTTDGTYLEYPAGRHLDFAYNSIITGMQPVAPNTPPDPKVVAAVDKALRVLFEVDDDGTISTRKTQKYRDYIDNTNAYGLAKASFAAAFAAAKSDPSQMAIWPIASTTYQNMVDQAKDDLISGGAQAIENALDTLASVGNPIQAHMIAKAKAEFDVWNLGLAGAVPSKIPYSYIMPTGWADPADDDEGWQKLTVTSSSYSHYNVATALSQSQYSWFKQSSSTGGGGSVGLGFLSLGGSGSTSSSSTGSQSTGSSQSSQVIGSDAKNLTISLEYALVDIQRPWLSSDLFYMQGWYLNGAKKNAISTGQAADQVGNAAELLPMIPEQMLVIRNVRISTSQWGSLSTALKTAYGSSQGSTSASSSNIAGSAGVSLGFISFGGSASHSSSSSSGQGSSFNSANSSSYFGSTFDGQTLSIKGAQVVAYLCDIVPACPTLDDPQLAAAAKPVAAGKAAAH